MKAVEIKKNVYWTGVLDTKLRVFDIVMNTPYGTTYNSYIVKGSEKVVLIETVKEQFFDEFLERLKSIDIDASKIDYIVVNHTEPDHAGSIAKVLEIAPDAKLVGSKTALAFVKGIINKDAESIIVKDGDTISLGDKSLKFISAPFLHWPDSMFTYVPEDNMLFTCDAFGCHYSSEKIFNDEIENKEGYYDALKYYFDAIMGPFKPYVIKGADVICDLNIDIICPGHGPVLRDNPSEIVELYRKWSAPYVNKGKKKIVICYVSAYGYTKMIADKIIEGINAVGDFDIKLYNVIENKIDDIMQEINTADGMLFGSPTINGDALKPIWDILILMNPIVNGRKKAGAFGSFGWSGEAVHNIEDRLKQLRIKIPVPGLRINFKPSQTELNAAHEFGTDFANNL